MGRRSISSLFESLRDLYAIFGWVLRSLVGRMVEAMHERVHEI